MQEVIGKQCVKCFDKVGSLKPGEFCPGCGRPIHHECKTPGDSSAQTGCCPTCGVTTRCDLCEQPRADAIPGFIYVQSTTPGLSSVSTQWVNLSCRCCEPCYRKARRIRWSGIHGAAIAWGIPILLCGGGGVLVANLFGEDGLLPEGFLGFPAKQLLDGFSLVAMLLCVLGFFGYFPIAGMLARRRIKDVLKPELDGRLRQMAGVSRWGAFANFHVRRQVPKGERIHPLS